MGHKRQTAEDTHENLCELLDWQFAERNDRAVAQALRSGQGVDTVYGLDEVGLLDGFFAFLDETGIKAHWQTLVIAGVRNVFLPAILFVLLYGTRVLFGMESSNALPALLFSNVAAMTLIGFNAHQVADGMSQRGAKLRTTTSEYTLMDPQTLAGAICKISAGALEELFNGTIRALAAFGVFMAEVMVAVDGTRVVTAPTFQGRGKLGGHRVSAQPAGPAGRSHQVAVWLAPDRPARLAHADSAGAQDRADPGARSTLPGSPGATSAGQSGPAQSD
jgi:hypothetical protein